MKTDQTKYIQRQVKLLLWPLTQPRNRALNTVRAPGPGKQPSPHSLGKGLCSQGHPDI